jgi:hypothetical protein
MKVIIKIRTYMVVLKIILGNYLYYLFYNGLMFHLNLILMYIFFLINYVNMVKDRFIKNLYPNLSNSNLLKYGNNIIINENILNLN